MERMTLAERIRMANSAEAWEEQRGGEDDARWYDPARVAKRERVQAACVKLAAIADATPRARAVLDLKRLAPGQTTPEERGDVELRMDAANVGTHR